ncbi:FxDxF family PEP-CTERM protein [Roseateles oligotrophus]|uniref:FxDxF family PEP-CTERM protein n=1 Tax=Roseateles oligotrophus TaxID=1769250 RepID=A0ABT2Y9F5_9BURK|nr:FxDxF family PEP-CTERM protein [Roseateles oligotrophus]MCV2366679.1 FxDxF family PEP-CTERM protein [Roseateles oligotrophus]
MRTRRAVGAASLALGLLVGATQVVAGPVMFKVSENLMDQVGRTGIKDDDVKDEFNFHLASAQKLSGALMTAGHKFGQKAVKSKLDITKVYLTSADNKNLAPIELVGSDADDLGVETWTLSNVVLTAGDWVLHVEGKGGLIKGGKQANSYSLQLTGVNAVPEPQTLALSLLALCGLVAVKRLRKA